MTVEEAKNLMTPEAIDKLKTFIEQEPDVKISNKLNNDILMNALCNAVTEGTIHKTSLDQRTVKLLASSTNTLQENKFLDIIRSIRYKQNVVCIITLYTKEMEKIAWWTLDGNLNQPDTRFCMIFEYVVNHFGITPQSVRKKLGNVLKPTIVNNVSQLVAKYFSDVEAARKNIRISVNTISRLVNMEQHMLFAEFKSLDKK